MGGGECPGAGARRADNSQIPGTTACLCAAHFFFALQELSALWESVVAELAAGNASRLARAALTFAYFWYNFMPLARGTAAAGYVAILSIFMAAGMPVTSPIPKVISYLPKDLNCLCYNVGLKVISPEVICCPEHCQLDNRKLPRSVPCKNTPKQSLWRSRLHVRCPSPRCKPGKAPL